MKMRKLTEKEQSTMLHHQKLRTEVRLTEYKNDLVRLKAPSQHLNEEFRAVEEKYFALQASLQDIQTLESEKQVAIDKCLWFINYVDSDDWQDDEFDSVSYEPHY
jgi:predicted nuclease with TOPRIM domain|tara:strand:+ start:1266 stop:1580 length:315 start_codon:yes stop_codon:yes gene_type:complete